MGGFEISDARADSSSNDKLVPDKTSLIATRVIPRSADSIVRPSLEDIKAEGWLAELHQ